MDEVPPICLQPKECGLQGECDWDTLHQRSPVDSRFQAPFGKCREPERTSELALPCKARSGQKKGCLSASHGGHTRGALEPPSTVSQELRGEPLARGSSDIQKCLVRVADLGLLKGHQSVPQEKDSAICQVRDDKGPQPC